MKIKCELCHGKGGYYKKVGWGEYFVSCFQCKGKGKWYTEKKTKKRK